MIDDSISRKEALEVLNKLARDNFTLIREFSFYLGALHDAADGIKNLPSAQPYTDEEIQKIQGLEQEQFDKIRELAYQEGRADAMRWIPCRVRLPDLDEDEYSDKVLVSFSNFTGCEICEYRIVDGKGDWYVGDSEDRPAEDGIHVNAWMRLPEPYGGE